MAKQQLHDILANIEKKVDDKIKSEECQLFISKVKLLSKKEILQMIADDDIVERWDPDPETLNEVRERLSDLIITLKKQGEKNG